MQSIEILAIERIRRGPLLDLYKEYEKRLTVPCVLHEIDGGNATKKLQALKSKIKPDHSLICLDERGKSYDSMAFANWISEKSKMTTPKFQFVIGGADGLGEEIRAKADLLLSFGKQTWPHKLARIMLIEQIYRTQQILAGHPYHRA